MIHPAWELLVLQAVIKTKLFRSFFKYSITWAVIGHTSSSTVLLPICCCRHSEITNYDLMSNNLKAAYPIHLIMIHHRTKDGLKRKSQRKKDKLTRRNSNFNIWRQVWPKCFHSLVTSSCISKRITVRRVQCFCWPSPYLPDLWNRKSPCVNNGWWMVWASRARRSKRPWSHKLRTTSSKPNSCRAISAGTMNFVCADLNIYQYKYIEFTHADLYMHVHLLYTYMYVCMCLWCLVESFLRDYCPDFAGQ